MSHNVDNIDPAAIAAVTAVGAENTDGSIFIPATDFQVISGTWTRSQGVAGTLLTRTADAAAHELIANIPWSQRTTASRGRKATAFRLAYSVDTADLDDVTLDIYTLADGGDDVGTVRATYGGLTNNDTDADGQHRSAVDRGDDTDAPELHTMTLTPPTPAYPGAALGMYAVVTVDGDAGAAGVFTLAGLWVDFSETTVDLA